MNPGDLLYILFLVICAWLALHWDDDIGGGKRLRVPLMP
jgi:hypothetical protein